MSDREEEGATDDTTEEASPFDDILGRLEDDQSTDEDEAVSESSEEPSDDVTEDSERNEDVSLDDEATESAESPSDDSVEEHDPEAITPLDVELGALLNGLERSPATEQQTPFSELVERVDNRKAASGASAPDGPPWARLEPGASVLLLGEGPADEKSLPSLSHQRASHRQVLLVNIDPTTETSLESLIAPFSAASNAIAVLQQRPVTASAVTQSAEISDPGNLTHIGISISNMLTDWVDSDTHLDICLLSLTALLRHAEQRRVFRFLHVLIGKVEELEANIHAYMDTTAHDPKTVALFEQLFDLTVRPEEIDS